MTTQAATLRYQLPQKAIKSDCPDCGPKHKRTLSRYVDSRTGEPLSDIYGRCDRESNCGYHLSPYHKGPSGLSYADWVYQQWKEEGQNQPFRHSTSGRTSNQQSQPVHESPIPIAPVYQLPDEVFAQSLGHYERNTFAQLLIEHFGAGSAADLLSRFQVGTSSYWPGSCVFWLKDEKGRVRGGQVVLFDETGHTAKRPLADGRLKRCTGWVHYALASRYDRQQQPRPEWLTTYIDEADKFPIPFGLHQLSTSDAAQAVAIVESPKTAIVCSGYFREFIWIAAGGKSYLRPERLYPLKSRKLVLFPDANAYYDLVNDKGQVNRGWQSRVEELREAGFSITISDYLEQRATDQEKTDGLDLADYLLSQWKGYPPDWDEFVFPETAPTIPL